jgi:Dyp-type peroxidase family
MAPADLTGGLERDDIQGLLASGYGHLREARFLLLAIDDPPRAAAWLGRLAGELTTASGKSRGSAVNVALAASGLAKLGLAPALGGFSDRFLDGMTALHRSRALGDVDDDAPENWAWGGPNTPPVDLLLLLYAEDKGSLAAEQRRLTGADTGLEVIHSLDTQWSEREHFGFRDGIAQPFVEGLREGRPDDTIRAGEFVLGYRNEHGQVTGRPLVGRAADPEGVLPTDPVSGDADLGRNGSYLVLRTLRQDVRAFWGYVDEATSGADGRSDPDARLRLAAQIVGRWPDGAPLVLAPDRPGEAPHPTNDFRYHDLDPDGLRCPLGAHIRRAHPRDMLDPNPGSERSIAIDKRHRLLRRGRGYGAPIAPNAAPNGGSGDDGQRGLHFMCLCANIARQFEFVQHTWLNNPKFNGLYHDADPLVGRAGRSLTLQAQPVNRRMTNLPSFISVEGGSYFFLPGVRAVRYLASLEPALASLSGRR